jgi:hypothetical protein
MSAIFRSSSTTMMRTKGCYWATVDPFLTFVSDIGTSPAISSASGS